MSRCPESMEALREGERTVCMETETSFFLADAVIQQSIRLYDVC